MLKLQTDGGYVGLGADQSETGVPDKPFVVKHVYPPRKPTNQPMSAADIARKTKIASICFLFILEVVPGFILLSGSEVRAIVENTFSMLKGIFPRCYFSCVCGVNVCAIWLLPFFFAWDIYSMWLFVWKLKALNFAVHDADRVLEHTRGALVIIFVTYNILALLENRATRRNPAGIHCAWYSCSFLSAPIHSVCTHRKALWELLLKKYFSSLCILVSSMHRPCAVHKSSMRRA